MHNNVLSFSKLSFSVLTALFVVSLAASCSKGSDLEAIEKRDDTGAVEKYQRRKKDAAKEGLYQRFYPEGSLAEEATYVNDSINGERKLFYHNGKVETVETYKHGTFDGPYKHYDENGNLQIEQTFINGAMEGWSIAYYPNGKLKEKVMMKGNNETGPFTEYYENGNLKTEGNYIYIEEEGAAVEQGELKEYDESGQLVRTADCDKGICKTKWKKE